MTLARLLPSAAALAAVAVLAGCGGASKNAKSAARLDKPIFPGCGTEGFPKPQVRPVTPPGGGRVWTVGYTRKYSPLRPARPGQTTNMAIIEYPPIGRQNSPAKGLTQTTIAGRRVGLRTPDKRNPAFVAQWNTSAASYTVLANGTNPTTVRRLVACLP
jgi:hypothetical protein